MSLDLDGSGDINKAEFLKAVRGSPEIVDKFKLLGFHDGTNWAKLFHDLDDGDGTLSLREFVDGLRSMLGEARGVDIIRTLHTCKRMHKSLKERMDVLFDFVDPTGGLISEARSKRAT